MKPGSAFGGKQAKHFTAAENAKRKTQKPKWRDC